MTAAQWPRRGAPKAAKRPDLEALTGLRSGKPHYYPEYRIAAVRLRRVILALERISGALVRTMEGSEALVRAVVDAAAEHLSAEWVVFALVEGELPDVRPRHLVRGPSDDTPEHVRHHVDQVSGGHPDGEHDAHQARHHLHVPIKLDGRVVGGFAAWTPKEREIEDTDHSVLRILAGQTAAALQNAALLDHSARLHARTARQAVDLKARNDRARWPPRPSWARRGSARCSTTSATASPASCTTASPSTRCPPGCTSSWCARRSTTTGCATQLATAKDLTRRAVEQLRSAIYALNDEHAEGEDLPSMLRRLSGVHMPDELSVEVRIGGKPVALPAQCEQSLFRIAGEALFNTAVHGEASRAVVRLAYSCAAVRLTISDDGVGRPEEVRRSLRAASAAPSGEHRGLVNMQARARELGGTLAFRRARLGGLQVQVEIPVNA